MQKLDKNFVFVLLFSTLILWGLFCPLAKAQTATQVTPLAVSVSSSLTTVPGSFVVPLNATLDQIAQSLNDQNYIKNKVIFISVFSSTKLNILPGAYKLTTGMTLENIFKVLSGKPYMKWVVIPPGLRKEEIADLLANNLNWTKAQENRWINSYTKMKYDDIEGVYFPNTYLIPVSETPLQTVNRLIAKFNENFQPYLLDFNKQNIQWTKGLTLASIVQREAANDADMPLIAGILLNRLNQKIPLSVDATLQYARGNKGAGWWAPITASDKKIVSTYNTYTNVGLPPHPICNPGLPAIEAVLSPVKTDCLYYLHDKNHVTHCAVTYAEHLANIQTYLK
jgi:UPF0755 protein